MVLPPAQPSPSHPPNCCQDNLQRSFLTMSFPHSKPSAARMKFNPLHSLHGIMIWTPHLTYLHMAPEQWSHLCFPTYITLFSRWYFCCLECSFHLDFLLHAYSSFPIWWLQHSLVLSHFLNLTLSENFLLCAISQPYTCFSCFTRSILLYYLLTWLSS